MHRYLVVANQTLGGEDLDEVIRRRMASGPCEFWVVVPATPVPHMSATYLSMPIMGGVPAIAGSPEEARKVAQGKLDAAVRQLTAAGAQVGGEVGDPDPMHAVQAAIAAREFDEIIVSTLPERLSRWLHQDLPNRLAHKFHLPVTHVSGVTDDESSDKA